MWSPMPDICSESQNYRAKDIFKSNKFGLHYMLALTTTVAAAKLADRVIKKNALLYSRTRMWNAFHSSIT